MGLKVHTRDEGTLRLMGSKAYGMEKAALQNETSLMFVLAAMSASTAQTNSIHSVASERALSHRAKLIRTTYCLSSVTKVLHRWRRWR